MVLPFDPAKATRRFEYSIGRRPGFVNGRPGLWWSINGRLFPDVPMYVVEEGDVVRMKIENHSRNVHPMHLGLVAHLMYAGVTEPFRVGGKADNAPE